MNKKLIAVVFIAFAFVLPIIIPIQAQAATCTATPSGTEGPYYLSGMPVRSNITETEAGIKTTLTFTVVDSKCKAVKGATVDVWHANMNGEYSGVDGNSGTYLRGSQVTNSKGVVTFTTIFPGWYPARTMHIHVMVWKAGQKVLTTQFFGSDKDVSKVYSMAPYATRGQKAVNNTRDGIYQGYGTAVSTVTLKISATTKLIKASGKLVI
jgi:protocatechuate 3,4-dioxygenase beta subunit